MNKQKITINFGVPGLLLFGVLAYLKVGLHVIDWSWWIITAPLWFGAAVVLGFLAILLLALAAMGIFAVIVLLIDALKK